MRRSGEGATAMKESGPISLSRVLNELFALRGYARSQVHERLHAAWLSVIPGEWSAATRVDSLKRGTLHIRVASAPLLAELVGFHQSGLLLRLKELHPDLKLKSLKFKLDSSIGRPAN